jgi:hypothetical protein
VTLFSVNILEIRIHSFSFPSSFYFYFFYFLLYIYLLFLFFFFFLFFIIYIYVCVCVCVGEVGEFMLCHGFLSSHGLVFISWRFVRLVSWLSTRNH